MAISFTPGQTVAGPDWEALFAQHGGSKSFTKRAPTKEEQRAADDADDDLEQNPIYRYYAADGSYVEARKAPNGDYQILDYKPSAKFTAQNPANPTATAQQKPPGGREGPEGTPTGQKDENGQDIYDNTRPRWVIRDAKGNEVWARPLEKGEREDWERDKNGGKTDAEIRAEQAVTAKPPEQKDEGGVRYVWKPNAGGPNAGGQWVPVGSAPLTPAERQAQDAAAPTQTQRTETVNGQSYTVITIVPKPGQPGSPGQVVLGPDGKLLPGGIPGKAPEESRTAISRNGQTYIQVSVKKPDGSVELYFTDQGGKKVELPGEGIGNLPAGFPAYKPDLTKPGQGLLEYRAAVDQWMLANPGKMTWENRTKILTDAASTASVIAGEFNTAAAVLRESYQGDLTQRGQDMSQSNARLGQATQGIQQAMATIEKLAPYLGASPGDAGKLFVGMQAAQMAHGVAMGGMRETPRESMDPRLSAFVDRTMGAPGQPPTPGAPPVATPVPGAPTPPNALGLGTGYAPAATPPASGTPAPVADPAMPPSGDAQVGNPDAPMPQAAPSGSPDDVIAVRSKINAVDRFILRSEFDPNLHVEIPADSPTLRNAPRPAQPMAAPTPVNPLPGQPGSNPNLPVGMAPPDATGRMAAVPPMAPPSWHQEAEQQMFRLEAPMPPPMTSFARPLPPAFNPGGGDGMGFDQFAPQPLMSRIPGMTPEIDAEARRMLAMEGVA